jgi:hypothetical protein
MNDARQAAYLEQVLSLDPRTEAAEALRLRREFLQPTDVFQAELAGGEDDGAASRSHAADRLRRVRRAFWKLGDEELFRELDFLQSAPHVELATAADRLRRVATQREAIRRLSGESAAHPVFMKSFTNILVAPMAEANRLREWEHRCMRPEQNEHYESAQTGVQETARLIRRKYPDVFALEEAWLTELLEYNPLDETEDETAQGQLGLLVAGLFVFTVFIVIGIVAWIFS